MVRLLDQCLIHCATEQAQGLRVFTLFKPLIPVRKIGLSRFTVARVLGLNSIENPKPLGLFGGAMDQAVAQ